MLHKQVLSQALTRVQHGESMLNLEGRIGGDATLSHRGEEYALKLPELVRESVGVSARPRSGFSVPCAVR
jgi:broad specificity phosphatase PhoE